jgi:hypothetical protein
MRKILLILFLALSPGVANAEEEIIFHKGLLKHEATAVYEALHDILISSFEFYLEAHFRYGKSAIRFEGSFKAADVSLSENHSDAILVYADLPGHCGSGGCTTYILLNVDGRWTEIGSSSGCYKLVVLGTRSNGLRDILPTECKYSDESEIKKFNGERYIDAVVQRSN